MLFFNISYSMQKLNEPSIDEKKETSAIILKGVICTLFALFVGRIMVCLSLRTQGRDRSIEHQQRPRNGQYSFSVFDIFYDSLVQDVSGIIRLLASSLWLPRFVLLGYRDRVSSPTLQQEYVIRNSFGFVLLYTYTIGVSAVPAHTMHGYISIQNYRIQKS